MNHVTLNNIYLSNLQRKSTKIALELNDNSKQQSLSFSGLISASNVKNFIISYLTIQNSNIFSLIEIFNVQNFEIRDLQIINCQQAMNNMNTYVLSIIGVASQTLSNIFITQNSNLQFIYATNKFRQNGTSYFLETDNFYINNLNISQNLQYLSNSSQVSVESSFCSFNNITYQNNQGNFFIILSQSLLIQNSLFQHNTGLNGGALALSQYSNLILIKNTTFQFNQAFASGGAIYLENVGAQIQMDNFVKINQNQDLIAQFLIIMLNSLEISNQA
ncbi:hypothetical protein ABPG72_018219 [Tetrahymena utriculariae]